jgi:hypothetical protein
MKLLALVVTYYPLRMGRHTLLTLRLALLIEYPAPQKVSLYYRRLLRGTELEEQGSS